MSAQRTLAVDPGIRGVGASYFVGPKLVYANYISNPITEGNGAETWFSLGEAVFFDFKERGFAVDTYVVEVPQIYRVSKGDPNDLLPLCAVAAAVGACFVLKRAVSYRPREYKGQLKKERFIELTMAQLSEDEKAAIVETRKSVLHNVQDSIGLGLFQLERDSIRYAK